MEKNNLNIVLIGMPGSGKTLIGKKLAEVLPGFDFVDTDELIEKDTGLSISEIFAKYGEKHFRELEEKTIKEVSQNKNKIISIGGGAFENAQNVENLRQNGFVVYLRTCANEIYTRVKNETHRPLFSQDFSIEKIENMLQKREVNYLKADFIIDTDNQEPYTVLEKIKERYDRNSR